VVLSTDISLTSQVPACRVDDTSLSIVPAAIFCCLVVLKLIQFELFDTRVNTIVCNM